MLLMEKDEGFVTMREPVAAAEKSAAEKAASAKRIADASETGVAAPDTVGDVTASDPVICVRGGNVHYGDTHALRNISLDVGRNEVIALIGPSGCGKSTFIRCLNRMNDTIESARVTGDFRLDGQDIYARATDVVMLRARVGMVFQKPNPFPKSIYENVAYGPRIHGLARSRNHRGRWWAAHGDPG